MVLLYSGFGLESINITFVDSTTYEVSEKQGKYLLDTFPTSFFIAGSPNLKGISIDVPEVVSSVVLDTTDIFENTVDTLENNGTNTAEVGENSKKRKRKIKE